MKLLLKNLLFTVVVPGSVGVYLPLLLASGSGAAGGWWRWSAVVCLLLGGAIYGWCVLDFASFGRGTPAPIDAPKRLVVHGLYRFSRNPMYVGVLTVILGHALLFRSPVVAGYLVVVALAFHLRVVRYEEPTLARQFGADFAAYRSRVPRWLLPRARMRLPG